MLTNVLLALLALTPVHSQTPPNSFPHYYPGIPNTRGDFTDSKAWQQYFLVDTRLPNQSFSLERSYAGNIPVNRAGHPNDTLFFWGFEKTNGSLTRPADDHSQDPWMIWLNGGPGSSSMLGLLFENGAALIDDSFNLVRNNYGWQSLADTIWIDQPVGTGHSTADSEGYIASEDQMGHDFMGFLSNLVLVFPSLAKRPLYLTGESYAGMYIPYITKTYFGMSNPPVNLAKIAIGDGAMSDIQAFEDAPVTMIIKTYPQLIDYDPVVYNYFNEQRHLCGYDLNFTYPEKGPFPTLRPNSLSNSTSFAPGVARSPSRSLTKRALAAALARTSKPSSSLSKRELSVRAERQAAWKRDLSRRANGTIDPWYECFLLAELIDYAVNFTKPWSIADPYPEEPGFDVYSIPDALDPHAPQNASIFLNDPVTRQALHAPTSKDWHQSINYPFANNLTNARTPGTNVFGDPSPSSVTFMTELATNSSARNISWVIYSGNDDLLVSHWGSEMTIQNVSFGGIQGFTQPPSTAWYGDDGAFAGIVHQERNLTYLLFDNAGHLVPQWQPSRALTFIREFVLGSNRNGSVVYNGTTVGVSHPLADDILPAEHNPIFTGSGTTMGSTMWPSATIAAWDQFMATATTAAAAAAGSGNGMSGAVAGARVAGVVTCVVAGVVGVAAFI